jgi:hypothetical protein
MLEALIAVGGALVSAVAALLGLRLLVRTRRWSPW